MANQTPDCTRMNLPPPALPRAPVITGCCCCWVSPHCDTVPTLTHGYVARFCQACCCCCQGCCCWCWCPCPCCCPCWSARHGAVSSPGGSGRSVAIVSCGEKNAPFRQAPRRYARPEPVLANRQFRLIGLCDSDRQEKESQPFSQPFSHRQLVELRQRVFEPTRVAPTRA